MKMLGSVATKDLDAGFQKQLDANMLDIDKFLNKVALYIAKDARNTSAFIDRTGNLRKSIRKKKSKFEDGGYIVVASGKNTTDSKGWHAHLIEFGHRKFIHGKDTGEFVPPNPFMRPAVQKGGRYAAALIRG